MIWVLLFIVIALALAGLLWHFVRGQARQVGSASDLVGRLVPVDVQAFRNLLDAQDDEFLRAHLDARAFRSIQRQRRYAALEYLGRVAQNAALALRVGQAARRSSDPQVVRSGEELAQAALQARIYVIGAMATVYASLVFPIAQPSLSQVVGTYSAVRERAGRLAMLERPALSSQVMAAF